MYLGELPSPVVIYSARERNITRIYAYDTGSSQSCRLSSIITDVKAIHIMNRCITFKVNQSDKITSAETRINSEIIAIVRTISR